LLVVQGLLPAVTVYLTRALVNSLAAALQPGATGSEIRTTLVLVGLMGGTMLLAELLRGAAAWVRTAQAERVQDHINALIHRQSAAVDLAFYESPDYYDHLHRARAEAGYRPVALLENLGQVLQHSLTLAAMAVVLLPYGLWLPLALLLSTLPALAVVLRYSLRQHQWQLRTTPDERRTWYYDWLLTSGDTAAELRLFDLGPHFQAQYQTLRQHLRRERLHLVKDQGLAELGASTLALQGQASLGDLALFYQAFNQGQGLMRSLLDNVGQIYYNVLFLGNLFEFLSLEPQVVDPPDPTPLPGPVWVNGGQPRGAVSAPPPGKGRLAGDQAGVALRFNAVSFRYPGSERLALQEFNLSVPAGQIAAVVGPNGAGKSTLIKLLCRFYDPEAGAVEINGLDLRRLALPALRQQLTVLFQEPLHYSMTVAQNIALSQPAREPAAADIEAAARAAGAAEPIARLPQGYDSLLGKWFAGGAELSVGEWQRLALARAFLRQAPLILLDEPTSAMDSWAEADWMRRFRRLAGGRTAIIITHRFTTAMQADVIHVLAGGQIVESGSHAQLLAAGGRYAHSWQAQLQQAGPDLGADPLQMMVAPNGC
jgi:ATP-binding cassette subfamily B protein